MHAPRIHPSAHRVSLPSQRTAKRRGARIALWLCSLTALAVLAGQGGVQADDATKILGDKEFFTKGSFIAYAAPWSTYFGAGKELKHGVDYIDEIAVRPETFPSNVDFSWH